MYSLMICPMFRYRSVLYIINRLSGHIGSIDVMSCIKVKYSKFTSTDLYRVLRFFLKVQKSAVSLKPTVIVFLESVCAHVVRLAHTVK